MIIVLFLLVIFICILLREQSDYCEEVQHDLNPIQLAEYIIWYSNHNLKQLVTLSKIVAILYVAQGVFLAKYSRALFNEDFEAWQAGPMLPSIYSEYRVYGTAFLPTGSLWEQEEFELCGLSKKEIRTFNTIIEKLMPYTGIDLRQRFTKQSPWKKNYIYSTGMFHPRKIPKRDIKDFFLENVN